MIKLSLFITLNYIQIFLLSQVLGRSLLVDENNSLKANHSIQKRQTNICSLVVCRNGGICQYSNNLAMCRCQPGYYGMYCQFLRSAPLTTPSTRNPFLITTALTNPSSFSLCSFITCQNGGACFSMNQMSVSCSCVNGFCGQFCQIPPQQPPSTDLCMFKNCQNGGQCFANSQMAVCICQNGYTGDLCQTPPIDVCAIKNDKI